MFADNKSNMELLIPDIMLECSGYSLQRTSRNQLDIKASKI